MHDVIVWLLFFGRLRTFARKLLLCARITSGQTVLELADKPGVIFAETRRLVESVGAVRTLAATSTRPWPYADASIDVILAIAELDHLASSQREACWSEILRVLRPSGRCFVFAAPRCATASAGIAADADVARRGGARVIECRKMRLPAIGGILFGAPPYLLVEKS